MRKLSLLLITFFAISLSACTGDKHELESLKSENQSLKLQLEEKNKEIDELKFGAEKLYKEAETYFNENSFQKAIDALSMLIEKHPASAEAEQGKSLLANAEESLRKEQEAKELVAKQEQEKREAEERQRIEAEKNKNKNIIRVHSVYPDKPNSASGVDFHVVWTNSSDKVVKYADFTVVPYNAVGDIMTCSIRRNSKFTGRVTGPVNPGVRYGDGYSWENAWYNNTITKVVLTEINIEYMDGSKVKIGEDKVNDVIY